MLTPISNIQELELAAAPETAPLNVDLGAKNTLDRIADDYVKDAASGIHARNLIEAGAGSLLDLTMGIFEFDIRRNALSENNLPQTQISQAAADAIYGDFSTLTLNQRDGMASRILASDVLQVVPSERVTEVTPAERAWRQNSLVARSQMNAPLGNDPTRDTSSYNLSDMSLFVERDVAPPLQAAPLVNQNNFDFLSASLGEESARVREETARAFALQPSGLNVAIDQSRYLIDQHLSNVTKIAA